MAVLLAGSIAVFGAAAGAQTIAPAADPAAETPASPLYLSITGRPATSPVPESRPRLTPDSDPGFYVGGVLGYAITDNLRAEIEAFYRHDGIDPPSAGGRPFDMTFTPSRPTPGGASLYGGMARGIWEFGNGTGFAPYVGGAVGMATAEFDIVVDSVREHGEESLFAYEFTAGARYTITPRSSIRAGYRLFGMSEPERDTGKPADRIHAIELGIKYRF